jgi:hypothetical protein
MDGISQKVFALKGPCPEVVPRGTAALVRIAPGARGHEISRRMVAPFDSRLNMIHREFTVRKHLAAIDAPIPVSCKDRVPSLSGTLRRGHG